MIESRSAGCRSARVYFCLILTQLTQLTQLVDPATVQKPDRFVRDINSDESANNNNNYFAHSLVITPKFTGLDCDFNQDCLWTWDADNFTEAASDRSILPGQNGFYRTNAEEVAEFQSASSKNFLGPKADPNGSKKGKRLLYLCS
jgi:hypothetical protein